ncbi:MAG TPA: hypothetical protein VI893_07630 [Thermoplasmata archaeon]|nr:hypothetical protein [Thermoplasmata archaeon]
MKKALQNGDSDLAHAIVSNLLPMMPRSSVVPLEDDLLRIAATTELGWYDDLWAIDLLLEQGVGDRGALMSLLEKKLKDSDPGRGMDISDILAKYRAG